MSPRDYVDGIVKKHKTRSPYELINSMNIALHRDDLGSVLGYYYMAYRTKHIVLNSILIPQSPDDRYVLAHEIGHSVMHPNANTPFLKANTYLSVDKMEMQANCFSMEYLISDDDLHDFWVERQYSAEMLSRFWGYREELIELRLKSYAREANLNELQRFFRIP